MRKIGWLLAALVLFSGCGAAETFETVSDELVQSVMAEPREVWMALPEDSVMPAMESEHGEIYICGDYDVAVQTLVGGDLSKTVQTVSGYDIQDLTVIQTAAGEVDKYEFVWTAAGELGQQIGRATVLDDGTYHYVLSATIDAELIEEYQEVWNGIFETFTLT